jgi:hypothetical protein
MPVVVGCWTLIVTGPVFGEQLIPTSHSTKRFATEVINKITYADIRCHQAQRWTEAHRSTVKMSSDAVIAAVLREHHRKSAVM